MKRLLAAAAVAGFAAFGAGITHAAADSIVSWDGGSGVGVFNGSEVDGAWVGNSGSVDSSGACASTSVHAHQDGTDLVNQSMGGCTP